MYLEWKGQGQWLELQDGAWTPPGEKQELPESEADTPTENQFME